jgi:hypothetical protein
VGRGSIEQPPPARKRSRTLSLRELRLWAASAAGPAVATGFYALATARADARCTLPGRATRAGYRLPMKAQRGPTCPSSRPARHIRPSFASPGVVLLLVPAHSSAGRSADGDGHRAVNGALAELRAAAANGLSFELRTARSFGRSRPLATLRIGQPLPAEQTEALRFNPWTTGPGIRPAGWLNLLRDAAYRASQRGRSRDAGPGGLFVARMHRRGGVGNQVPESPPMLHRQRAG